jgi:hypothetical protein
MFTTHRNGLNGGQEGGKIIGISHFLKTGTYLKQCLVV